MIYDDTRSNDITVMSVKEALKISNNTVIEDAMTVAITAHNYQTRDGGSSYIEHPKRVMKMIEDLGVNDEEILSAALLHDVYEDSKWLLEDINDVFGLRITQIVDELSLDFSPLTTNTINRLYRDRIKTLCLMGKTYEMSPEACLIKLADRIDNIRGCADVWDQERVQAYINQGMKLCGAIKIRMQKFEDFEYYSQTQILIDELAATCSKTYTKNKGNI